MIIKPTRELHIPGNRRPVQRANLFEEGSGQKTALLILMIRKALRQGPTIEIVERYGVVPRPPIA